MTETQTEEKLEELVMSDGKFFVRKTSMLLSINSVNAAPLGGPMLITYDKPGELFQAVIKYPIPGANAFIRGDKRTFVNGVRFEINSVHSRRPDLIYDLVYVDAVQYYKAEIPQDFE